MTRDELLEHLARDVADLRARVDAIERWPAEFVAELKAFSDAAAFPFTAADEVEPAKVAQHDGSAGGASLDTDSRAAGNFLRSGASDLGARDTLS
jgi:hypothetical protein